MLDNRGVALFAIGRFEDALASFDRALSLKADDAETLYHRGHALANLGRYDEASSRVEEGADDRSGPSERTSARLPSTGS